MSLIQTGVGIETDCIDTSQVSIILTDFGIDTNAVSLIQTDFGIDTNPVSLIQTYFGKDTNPMSADFCCYRHKSSVTDTD